MTLCIKKPYYFLMMYLQKFLAPFRFLFFFFLFSFHQVSAQSGFSGKVVDAQAQPIAGAVLHLLNTNQTAVTRQDGSFSFSYPYQGNFLVRIEAAGYASITRPLSLPASAELRFTLEPSIRQLDEVIVTAEKREEIAQRLPLSISVLSSRQVADYRLWDAKELTAIVPNLYAADPGDKRNVTSLRGIATTSYDPAVATYVDGVNQFGLDTYIGQLFDVERIEVLRGPQGTLYGRNAMAGVINVITRKPRNQAEGFAEVFVGNHNQQRYSAGIRLPLVRNKLFFGAAGLYDKRDGFYMNEFNNSSYDKQHSTTGNYYLNFLPHEKWSFLLNVKHNHNRNNGPFPLVFGDAVAAGYRLNQNATTRLMDDVFNASFSINHTASRFNLSAQTAYQSNYRFYSDPIDADFSPIDGISIINNYGRDWNRVQVLTQEIRLSSSDQTTSPLKWTAGTYLFRQKNPVKQATHFGSDAAMVGVPDNNFSLINTTDGQSSGIAFYGQATYRIAPKLNLTAGARYDYEEKKQSVVGEYQKAPDPAFVIIPDTSAAASFRAFSPRLSVDFPIAEGRLLFLTYSKGFRSGGLTPLSSDPSQPHLFAFKPEHSHNLELGTRNSLFGKRVFLNVTAFYTTVTDVQVPTLVLPDAVTITRNTGELRSRGFEAELNATPLSGLEVHYNFGWNKARFKTLKLAQGGSEIDLQDKRQIFTPELTSMLAVQYSLPLNRAKTTAVVARGEWRYLGRQYFDLANTITQPAYHLFHARAGVHFRKLALMFWGRNLGDERYISYAYDFGAAHLGDPLTYGASLSVRF